MNLASPCRTGKNLPRLRSDTPNGTPFTFVSYPWSGVSGLISSALPRGSVLCAVAVRSYPQGPCSCLSSRVRHSTRQLTPHSFCYHLEFTNVGSACQVEQLRTILRQFPFHGLSVPLFMDKAPCVAVPRFCPLRRPRRRFPCQRVRKTLWSTPSCADFSLQPEGLRYFHI